MSVRFTKRRPAAAARATGSRARAVRRNPLLEPWRTPFGLPPFSAIEPRHFLPAFKVAMAEHRGEIRRIARQTARPSFANTILPLERSGERLARVSRVFFNLASADTSPRLQEIEREIAPQLAAHHSAILLDKALFTRIADLYERRRRLDLDGEQRRVLELHHLRFMRAGAALGAAEKRRVAEIHRQLAALCTRFAQNVLMDEQSWQLRLETEDDLSGLPDPVRAAAARAASDLGLTTGGIVTLARSSVESFLQFSSRRDLREEAFRAWTRRGEMGGETDNRPIVAEVVALRAELARLLGYASYADYALADCMAKTPDRVRDLLDRVWPAALKRAQEERAALQELVGAEGGNFTLAPWDWRYYAEKLRQQRYQLADAEVRPYLELDNIIAAAFDCASRLFGLRFTERTDLPRYHEDVRTWEVTDSRGNHVGLFLGDYFARPSKRSGAWMSVFRSQHKLRGEVRPIVVNVMNFTRGAQGRPTLLSIDDARTLFHEFGHGLHGLLSDVTFPSISGTNVPPDFVELPSQLFEHWLMQPEVLGRFALHAETGEPMPRRLIEQLDAARHFNQGFATVEFTASALLDMELHAMKDVRDLDVPAFERAALARLGMPPEIVMRHRLPHFLHIMGGYAAGYYSYLWSEVMDSDAFAAFKEAGDIFDRKVARRLRRYIYSAGNRRDPAAAYREFRGRDPEINSLLEKRGLL